MHLVAPTTEPPDRAHPGWVGALSIGLASRGGRTSVTHREHRGPLQVQRAFYPEGPGVAHVYLLHPPGGIVAGDDLSVDIAVASGAHALVTTPAAAKVYRSDAAGREARQRQRLRVQAGGALEWLPQETIAFAGTRARLETRVELQGDARFVGWETLCLGRTASGETFDRGACEQRLSLWRDGRPLVIDRVRVEGGGALAAAPWGLAGRPVLATLLATPAPASDERLAALRALGERLPAPDLATATVLDGALVCRYRGDSTERARTYFAAAWAILRPAVLGLAPVPPRIWAT